VFIYEDAIVYSWSKLAIRDIISVLVLMFECGLRVTDLSGDEESKKMLQYIYELSSRMTAENQSTDDNPTVTLPALDTTKIMQPSYTLRI